MHGPKAELAASNSSHPLTSCVILSKLLSLSVFWFLSVKWYNNSINTTGLLTPTSRVWLT